MRRKGFLVAALVLTTFAVLAGSAMAGGGNSANAKLCQKAGWEGLETDAGGHFADAAACTSYAATGGTLYSPTLSPVFAYCLGLGVGDQVTYYALYAVEVSGFHSDSVVSFRLPGSSYPNLTVTTDATGSATTAPSLFVFSPGAAASLEATDAEGVDGSVHFAAATC